MDAHTFTLCDGDGVEHTYEVLPHNTDEGLPIVGRLMQAGLPGLAAALGSGVLPTLLAARSGAKVDPAALLAGIDVGALGEKLGAAIPQLDLARLGPELMKRTTRDGAPLANPAEFNKAFRANYWELISACRAVIELNRFLPRLGS